MLRTLTAALLRRRRDTAQLALEFDAQPRDAGELLARLRGLGLKRIGQCTLTRNRNVMVSFRGAELRVHHGYLSAPRDVHEAIVTFIEGRTRADRRAAQRRIIAFEVARPREPARRERTRPDDEPIAAKLAEWHARYNAEHFDGSLRMIPVRVSRRMKSRLGHYTAATDGRSGEIAVSWRHLRRHGWQEVLDTLLHEMVHQWQDETQRPIDHGRAFRAKARDVGITASARRAPRS
ncbi:MAG: SprT-like domain-containing protein [Gemmatimonadaceae bacterium]